MSLIGVSRYLLMPVVLASFVLLGGCGGSSTQVPPPMFSIGGTVVNLAGSAPGLVLQDNGGDNLPVDGNGSFSFPTALANGSAYSVSVFTQPSSPAQTCSVANATGTVTSDVTNVEVNCGHMEWGWITGTKLPNQIGVYGTLGTAAAANTPGGRQYPATWTDKSGNLWLFGGYGHDSAGNLLPFNDLWEFSGGQWIWMGGPALSGQNGSYGTFGVASPTNIPGARFEAASWTDSSGNLWLFGGNGFDSAGNESPMNDLWKYSNGQWTWMGGSKIGLQNGNYGTLGVASPSNEPGGRASPVIWIDSSGNLWLFGGLGYDASNPINGELSDLWKYSNGEWTWMGGPQLKQQPGVYGTLGTASPENVPGSRYGAFGSMDKSGNFWLFGGYGYDSTGEIYVLNDLWEYSSGQWTWVGGSKLVNQRGVYGTLGVPAPSNIPGSRQFGVSWTDASGDFWIFGGNGFDATGGAGYLNDLWKFSGGQWAWMAGSNMANPGSNFGTQGALAPGNAPGGRFFLTGWSDPQGNLWLFGGYGISPAGLGNLNDLWTYTP
ncbi:MAG TPA: hypothetical protein VMD77_11785 [Candidatus Baltobacteraceae bacterium]|nr:hypothetical protein [Candidatus Baltobacteraceae bacterium]